jgi:hypothetical protein
MLFITDVNLNTDEYCLNWNVKNLKSTDIRRLTTGIPSKKCVFRRFHRCAYVIDYTYKNLDSAV